ncbi:unnamed protein product [Pseudo-nitzschia multistriata]|uniref:Uracil-DNA glycosylase n=1 Tax=Pseudo-nitzschia multistriata TaxID=183589 RepID=A0A448ZEI7_9STRA|nr:unnamed protein product [Pseudo-nitzschia multistriata]
MGSGLRRRHNPHRGVEGVKQRRQRGCCVAVGIAMATLATVMLGNARVVWSFSFRCCTATGRSVSPSPRSLTSSGSSSSFRGDTMRLKLRPRMLPPFHTRDGNPNRHRCYSGASSLCMMPEGPEVRTLVDQLQGGIGKRLVDIKFLSGRYLQQRPKGFSDFAGTMTPLARESDDGSKTNRRTTIDVIRDINCKGKFIYMLLDDGCVTNRKRDDDARNEDDDDDFQRSIWITLGMTGRFVSEQKHLEDPSYGRWVLELVDDDRCNQKKETHRQNPEQHRIFYHDKRNFGTVRFCLSKQELDEKLASLGPDVLALARERARIDDVDDASVTIDDELEARSSDAKATQEFLSLLERQRNPRLNVCRFLMDQKKISGIGNYILSEALYRASIDPFCGIDELSTSQRIKLFQQAKAVCYESYVSQQQSQRTQATSEPYTSVRSLEPFDFQLRVYGQLKCPRGSPVVRETNGPHGRTIWYTNDQLFVARNLREEREQQQQEKSLGASATAKNFGNEKEDRWTIIRKDGIDVGTNEAAVIPDEDNKGIAVWNLLDGLHEPGWKQALEPYAASSRSFEGLKKFLEEEYATHGEHQIYPPRHQIFAALNLCPLDKVKVVILGQDPYHGPNQSTGLAFSVSKSISKIPPSLRNIFRELDDDVGSGLGGGRRPPVIQHGDLEGWARQGVLMLNTVLTVRRGQANSHQRKGWEDFTDEIVCILRDRANEDSKNHNKECDDDDNNDGDKRGGIVFLLWGGPAAKKAKSIVDSDARHVVIATSHPSPLGATKTASPFLTSRCFSRVNEALIEMDKTPIDWYNR